MNPQHCYHWEKTHLPSCVIENSAELTPAWVECEMPGCKAWLHVFCIKEETPQVDPWFCQPCKQGKWPPLNWRR